MTFLPKAQRYAKDALIAHILALPAPTAWAPKFVVLHNTAGPTLPQWQAYSDAQKLSQGDNLNAFYRGMGWHSGPHWEVTPGDASIGPWTFELCDPGADGVHASCFNHVAYGVEMVGDYRAGGDDFSTGDGALVRDQAIALLAALHKRFGWDPADYEYGVKGLHFHHECTADHHDCPGAQVDKPAIIAAVKAAMASLGAPLVDPVYVPAPTPIEPEIVIPAWPDRGTPAYVAYMALGARCFNRWKAIGMSNPFALGALANGEAECSLDVAAIGDHDQAHGLYQWHGDRCAAIKAGCGIDVIADKQIEHHVDAAWWELNASEAIARDAVAGCTTGADAATAFAIKYERCGAPLAAQKRGRLAERWAVEFSTYPALLSANPAQP